MAIPMFNYVVRDPTPVYVLVVIDIHYAAVQVPCDKTPFGYF